MAASFGFSAQENGNSMSSLSDIEIVSFSLLIVMGLKEVLQVHL